MKNTARFSLFLTAIFAFTFVGSARAEEGAAEKIRKMNYEYGNVTTKEGLTFRVPEDMPIEKRDGILAPLPFDEYTFRKFKLLEERIRSLESKITLLEARLNALEKPEEKTGLLIKSEAKTPQPILEKK